VEKKQNWVLLFLRADVRECEREFKQANGARKLGKCHAPLVAIVETVEKKIVKQCAIFKKEEKGYRLHSTGSATYLREF